MSVSSATHEHPLSLSAGNSKALRGMTRDEALRDFNEILLKYMLGLVNLHIRFNMVWWPWDGDTRQPHGNIEDCNIETCLLDARKLGAHSSPRDGKDPLKRFIGRLPRELRSDGMRSAANALHICLGPMYQALLRLATLVQNWNDYERVIKKRPAWPKSKVQPRSRSGLGASAEEARGWIMQARDCLQVAQDCCKISFENHDAFISLPWRLATAKAGADLAEIRQLVEAVKVVGKMVKQLNTQLGRTPVSSELRLHAHHRRHHEASTNTQVFDLPKPKGRLRVMFRVIAGFLPIAQDRRDS